MKLIVLLGALAAALSVAAPASAATIVTPAGLDAIEGNSGSRNVLGFINVARLQQVFSSSQFVGGPITLTGLAFRANGANFGGIFGGPGTAFTRTTQGLQISLSTTNAAADGLSTSFASNVGANVVNVIPRSDVTYSSNAGSANGVTKDFDVFFSFVNPFVYDPSMGNLLLDLISFGGSNRSGTTLDGQDLLGDGTSSLFRSNGTDGSGTASTFGYITQFTTGSVAAVPEPGTWAMMLIGFGMMATSMRYRRRTSKVVYG